MTAKEERERFLAREARWSWISGWLAALPIVGIVAWSVMDPPLPGMAFLTTLLLTLVPLVADAVRWPGRRWGSRPWAAMKHRGRYVWGELVNGAGGIEFQVSTRRPLLRGGEFRIHPSEIAAVETRKNNRGRAIGVCIRTSSGEWFHFAMKRPEKFVERANATYLKPEAVSTKGELQLSAGELANAG